MLKFVRKCFFIELTRIIFSPDIPRMIPDLLLRPLRNKLSNKKIFLWLIIQENLKCRFRKC